MAKRQVRIYQSSIVAKLDLLLGQKVSVVLKNNSVVFVKLVKFEGERFEANDINQRVHHLSLAEIQEIILEQNA